MEETGAHICSTRPTHFDILRGFAVRARDDATAWRGGSPGVERMSFAMCHVVYVATDQPLPTSSWDQNDRKVFIEDMKSMDELVRQHFSAPLVYYAGSDLGCGCGFAGNAWEDPDDEEVQSKVRERQTNSVALARVLHGALAPGGRAQVYMCWNGDEALPAEQTGQIALEDLEALGFQLVDRQFLTVRA